MNGLHFVQKKSILFRSLMMQGNQSPINSIIWVRNHTGEDMQ